MTVVANGFVAGVGVVSASVRDTCHVGLLVLPSAFPIWSGTYFGTGTIHSSLMVTGAFVVWEPSPIGWYTDVDETVCSGAAIEAADDAAVYSSEVVCVAVVRVLPVMWSIKVVSDVGALGDSDVVSYREVAV